MPTSRAAIGADGVQVFYREAGSADGPVLMPPETYTLDFALMQRPGNEEI
jgi:hypothetical protein